MPEHGLKRTLFLFLLPCLFLSLFFLLSFKAHLASDDFYYLWLTKKFGAWGGMMYQYENWSGRWSAHWLACLLIPYWKNSWFLPLFHFITLAALVYSIYRLIILAIAKYSPEIGKGTALALSILFCASFFFASYDIGETWFWYIIIITYLWSIVAFLFLIGIVFNRRSSLFALPVTLLLSAYIGGASESFALIFLFFLSVILLYRTFIAGIKRSDPIQIRLIFGIIVLLASLGISALAPGTDVRRSALPHVDWIDTLWVISKTYVKYFVRFLPSHIFFLILLSASWLYIGDRYLRDKIDRAKARRLLLNTTLLFLAALLILFIPTSMILSETGPDRALSIVSLATALFFLVVFAMLGVLVNRKTILRVHALLLAIAVGALAFTCMKQYRLGQSFDMAYRQMMDEIDRARNSGITVLELERLPPDGMLYWDPLTTDTSYFVNRHLQQGLELPFPLRAND